MCIKDDATSLTGRIRHCGICGVVACDEDCGVELVECTDVEGWNNAGEFIFKFVRRWRSLLSIVRSSRLRGFGPWPGVVSCEY